MGLRLFLIILSTSVLSYFLQQDQEERENVTVEGDSLSQVTPGDSLAKQGHPVLFEKDTLYVIYKPIGPFTAEDRAANTNRKLEALYKAEVIDSSDFSLEKAADLINIRYKDEILASVTNEDAEKMSSTKEQLAAEYLQHFKEAAIANLKEERWLKELTRIALLLLTIVAFFFAIKFLNKGFNYLIEKSVQSRAKFIKGLKIKDYELISVKREQLIILQVLKVLKWVIIVFLISLTLPTLFSIFPATESLAHTIFYYLLNPVKKFGSAVISYLPNLFTIVVVIVITRYILKFLYFLSREVERGKLEIPGFFPDWARPTFNLLRVVIFAFAFIVIFPYLPGSDSPVFQGVSVFLGLLISLGSSTAIGNIIAGLVITYMRAFKIGDRVKIGETTGDVIEKTMLVTRVRTIKNEEVSIPNSSILIGSTINYSANASEVGLVVHSTVTIGYDVPWRKVHELLIAAALETELIKKEPTPFVFQTSLDDYSVSYQINAYTDQPGMIARIKSDLHQHIQDAFNKANIEILSPGYTSVRDGNRSTTPEENLPKDYKKPGFDVNVGKPDKGE
ncbi:mechanosensitive ion channel family protein [Salegentibacter chungangensis]|uniref:Mechanosensitive ion channel family protein n=1 Tax=Salegentibacter chungangensis TaxID=1335724 RepID=A0ABW3NR66_9FLAO